MRVIIELFGLARRLTGKKEIELDLPRNASLGTLAVALSRKAPELLGQIIDPKTYELASTYAFSLNGSSITRNLNTEIRDERVLVIPTVGGG